MSNLSYEHHLLLNSHSHNETSSPAARGRARQDWASCKAPSQRTITVWPVWQFPGRQHTRLIFIWLHSRSLHPDSLFPVAYIKTHTHTKKKTQQLLNISVNWGNSNNWSKQQVDQDWKEKPEILIGCFEKLWPIPRNLENRTYMWAHAQPQSVHILRKDQRRLLALTSGWLCPHFRLTLRLCARREGRLRHAGGQVAKCWRHDPATHRAQQAQEDWLIPGI